MYYTETAFFLVQKTGLLDFKASTTVGNGRRYWWLDPKADSLDPKRGHYCPRNSLGSRCKYHASTSELFFLSCEMSLHFFLKNKAEEVDAEWFH